MEITLEWAADHFLYDPHETLALRWKKLPPKTSRISVGDIAGYWHPTRAGSPIMRRYVSVGEVRVSVVKVVWALCKGEIPPRAIFFIEDNGDYRIENLTPQKQKWFKYSPEERIKRTSGFRFTEWKSQFTEDEWAARIRSRNLKRDYNLTPEQWQQMYNAQNGTCAICLKPETLVRRGKTEVLSVDHCHDTNRVRALLCGNCNNGLGRFLHSPALLRAAADYLERH